MATNITGDFNLPFPRSTDPVNVHGDLESLASKVDEVIGNLDLSVIQVTVKNTSGVSIPQTYPVVVTGFDGVTTVRSATAADKPVFGLMKQPLANGSQGVCVVAGVLSNVNTSGFSDGDVLYVDENGGLVSQDINGNKPVNAGGAVGIVAYAATSGTIIVEAKGNGTWGALKAGLA